MRVAKENIRKSACFECDIEHLHVAVGRQTFNSQSFFTKSYTSLQLTFWESRTDLLALRAAATLDLQLYARCRLRNGPVPPARVESAIRVARAL